MPTSIRLPDNIESRLDFLANQTGRTKAFYIREMILEKIGDLEEYYLAANKEKHIHRVKEAASAVYETRKDQKPDVLAKSENTSVVDLIIANRRKIIETCLKYGATNARIFGSCARNDYNDKSDVDVLVKMPLDLRGFNYINRLCDLEEELAKLLGVSVDLVDEAALKGNTRDRILKEAIAL